MGEILRVLTPEARELEKKKEYLAALEAELAEKELEILTLQADLRAFEQRYLRVVGVVYAELDDVKAQIAEDEARRDPQAADTQRRAAEARARAQSSADETGEVAVPTRCRIEASEELKHLYREAAKKIHPDLANDDDEREWRAKLMVEANLAYEAGDEDRLRGILAEWETRPESVKGDGPGAELVRVIRKIAQIEGRLSEIEAETTEAIESQLYGLMESARETEEIGRDLLADMAEDVRRQIREAQARLAKIEAGGTADG
ncbi:MAG: J domain-containing protein [Armatimonadota bacterium]|nr:J domain-containing protein [Armatimonadota bacterium]